MGKSEVLSFHIGQAGCNMGTAIWDLCTYEMGLDLYGHQNKDACETEIVEGKNINLGMHFHENSQAGYSPRAVFIDSEKNVIEEIQTTSRYSKLFVDEHMITGTGGAGGCFARGKFKCSKEIFEQVKCSLRQSLENCAHPGTMCFYNSICGGTGSGLGLNVVVHLADNYPKVVRHAHSLVPSNDIMSVITSPYNAVLSLASTLGLYDVQFIYDNQTCYNIYEYTHKVSGIDTTFHHVNHLIGQVIGGLACTSRWDSDLDCDFAHFQTNLVPFPSVNMISPSLVPINHKYSKCNYSVHSLTAESFLNCYEMSTLTPREGKYIACAMIYRGNCGIDDVSSACMAVRDSFEIPFVDWVPTGFKLGLCGKTVVHPNRMQEAFKEPAKSLLKLTNHTGMFDVCDKTIKKYDSLHLKGAYIHWYIREGMEEGEFVDASEKILDNEKQLRSTCSVDDDDDSDDSDAADDGN